MDPLNRADAQLSRARARGRFVVTPDSAISPMDAANTQQIPHQVVDDADSTTIVGEADIHDSDENYLADETPTTVLESETDPDATLKLGASTADPDVTQDLRVKDDEDDEDEIVEEELDGLLPTVTQRKKSKVSRRLDG